MFTIEQIESAHAKVKTGTEFPAFIQEIKGFGVLGFQTWVRDSHTQYFCANEFQIQSKPKYKDLEIASLSDPEKFIHSLKIHQMGETDYFTFCQHCAESGIEKWSVDLEMMTCTYFDKAGVEILVEKIPGF